MQKYTGKKRFSLDRLPLYDTEVLIHMMDGKLNNFEYYIDREYAYNRDKGKCKIYGGYLNQENRYCHRVEEKLPANAVNKVPNLAWICKNCVEYVHGRDIPKGIQSSGIKKIQKYRSKLN